MTFSMKLFRFSFGTYSRALPAKAAQKAVGLMTSPRISEEKRNAVRAQFNYSTALKRGGTLSVYGQGSKSILLLHGWSGWVGQFSDLLNQLDPAEYTILAVNPMGHGDSYANESHPGRFIEAVLDTYEFIGKNIDVAIGHSLGSAALVYVQAVKQCFNRLALVSGPASIEGVLNRFASFLDLGESSRDIFIRKMEGKVGLTIDQLDLVKLAPSIKQPVLLFHDRDDREIPASDSHELDKAFPRSRLVETRENGHNRILKDDIVITEILEFLGPVQEVRKAS
ncbi:alpha/beta fold hydrolase [Marinobacter sp. CHS3-4]|uniref:alpha/beta fold hydrolase n=1 Tax=Marinobacter sp. CHS3-4 TaxID=3045174 RepID=UPI0024B527C2|nr:alpha/beta fold hydrolase [Marinobacter sp. CHS3-4]MDI9245326.1 alpha/beta fold hydrolase [Marinobacter sp. CHS3-4]